MQNNNSKNQLTDLQRFSDLLPAPHPLARRSFLRSLGLGAALLTPVAGALTGVARGALAAGNSNAINAGDAAILRFLAAAELLKTDLWQQYTELATGNEPYMGAIEAIDDDFPQYIADNTDDELSHATFLNAYLAAGGAQPVNLDPFRRCRAARQQVPDKSVDLPTC